MIRFTLIVPQCVSDSHIGGSSMKSVHDMHSELTKNYAIDIFDDYGR